MAQPTQKQREKRERQRLANRARMAAQSRAANKRYKAKVRALADRPKDIYPTDGEILAARLETLGAIYDLVAEAENSDREERAYLTDIVKAFERFGSASFDQEELRDCFEDACWEPLNVAHGEVDEAQQIARKCLRSIPEVGRSAVEAWSKRGE